MAVTLAGVAAPASGGVDQDGRADLLLANGGENVVCLQDGAGGFFCTGDGVTGKTSEDVELGDLNDDGLIDAVYANSAAEGFANWACLGDGEGSFACSDISDVAYNSVGVDLGDLNGDGNLDAVFANRNQVPSHPSRVCLGDGGGSFVCSDVDTSAGSSHSDVALGFIDGDDRLDALFTGGAGYTGRKTTRTCIGDGKGGFSCMDGGGPDIAPESYIGRVELGNFDGDTELDAVITIRDEPNLVCLGLGTGKFECNGVSTDENNTSDVGLGDFNGDSKVDAAFSNNGFERSRICLGDGSGGFRCSDISRHEGASGIGVGDIDADGNLDIAIAGETVDRACLGDGTGKFSCSNIPGTQGAGDIEVAAATPRCHGSLATIWGTSGNDVLVGTSGDDVIVGLGGNDKIYGKRGNDILCGNAGSDKILPGKGVDHVYGGGGSRDWVIYSSANRRVVVSLRTGVGRGQGRDTLVSIENIVGSPYNDKLIGNSRTNRIRAGAGADSVWGKGGDDFMWGQAGRDTLNGGSGSDVARGGTGADTCTAEVALSC